MLFILYIVLIWQLVNTVNLVMLASESAPGHLHQGGIWISRGGTNHVVCVCFGGGGGGYSGGKRAIYDRVQLLTLAKACNRFLMCAVLSVSLSLSKSIRFSKEGRGWKVGGTVTRLGGHGPGWHVWKICVTTNPVLVCALRSPTHFKVIHSLGIKQGRR